MVTKTYLPSNLCDSRDSSDRSDSSEISDSSDSDSEFFVHIFLTILVQPKKIQQKTQQLKLW